MPVESLILVECDRIVSAAEQKALVDELTHILSDVRGAVVDWQPMLSRVKELITASEKFTGTHQSHGEGIAFLRWLEDRHFTFLGARDYELKRNGNQVSLVALARLRPRHLARQSTNQRNALATRSRRFDRFRRNRLGHQSHDTRHSAPSSLARLHCCQTL